MGVWGIVLFTILFEVSEKNFRIFKALCQSLKFRSTLEFSYQVGIDFIPINLMGSYYWMVNRTKGNPGKSKLDWNLHWKGETAKCECKSDGNPVHQYSEGCHCHWTGAVSLLCAGLTLRFKAHWTEYGPHFLEEQLSLLNMGPSP